MSGPNSSSRAWIVALAVTGLLLVAACQPPQLPESAIVRLPASVTVRTGGHVQTVLLEEYVLGSALAEVSPVDQSPAAVGRIFEVQAVLARTYAAVHLGKHSSEGFDLCDTTHCQLYDPNRIRVSRFSSDARDAVRRTAGLVLTYHGQLAEGLYHADCGGYTASAVDVWGGSVPYLIGAPDDVPSNLHRQWTLTVPSEQLRAALNASPRAEVGKRLDRLDLVDTDCGGHVNRIASVGEHTHELRGEEFRTIVNRTLGARAIQSTLFTVTRTRTDFVFSGAGFGHGVGLCQVGAAERARQGESLQAIVSHYFPGVVLAKR
jgi:stage II sporulation protein D